MTLPVALAELLDTSLALVGCAAIDVGLPLGDGPRYAGLFADANTTLWSGALRILQAIVAAAPFLVTGAVVAGCIRGLLGEERLRAWLGVGRRSGPLRAWLLGILLPVDSLGALPVAAEMRRSGVPGGTVLSFVLVAPVLNPISILYGLSNIVPHTLLFFAVGTFAVSTGIGRLWNRVIGSAHGEAVGDSIAGRSDDADAGAAGVEPNETATAFRPRFGSRPPGGLDRILLAATTAARSVVGPVAKDLALALLAVGLLGALLPHGLLQTSLTRENAWAPVLMGLVAIPAYVTPIDVMMHFGNIVRDGYSLGAAFALIVLGAGANVGVAAWVRRDYGLRPLLLFVALLIGSTLVIGLTADRTLVHGRADAADHTHAFDTFTRLPQVFDQNANLSWALGYVAAEIRQNQTSGTAEVAGLVALAALVVIGLAVRIPAVGRWVDRRTQPETIDPEAAIAGGDGNDAPPSGLSYELSARQLAAVGIVGVVTLAVAGLYLLYPPPGELMSEIGNIRLGLYDAIDEVDGEETARRTAQFRVQLDKLPTAIRIRGGTVTEAQLEAIGQMRHALDTTRKAVERADGEAADATNVLKARLMRRHLEDTFRTCKQAFQAE